MLRIEKFIAGKHTTTIRVPCFVFRLASALLPQAEHRALAARRIDLREIKPAIDSKTPYWVVFAVCERGINTRILISLH